jgi:hypothetical protein
VKAPKRIESSATFSLGELMKLEDERVAKEKRELEAKMKADADAKLAAIAKAKADASAAAEAKRRADFDELARREAMRKAPVEQARIEGDDRARAAERERERRHELELAALRSQRDHEKSTGIGPLIGAMALGGALMLAVALAVHFGVEKPATDRRITELDLREGTAEQRATNAEQRFERQQHALATCEKNKSTLEARLAIQPDALAPTVKKPTTVVRPTRAKPPKADRPGSSCDQYDPMCF